MQNFTSKIKFIEYLSTIEGKKTIGFVPTMGAIHQGHISLIKKSNTKCDITVCSIFINPTQFNCVEDFANYPNTLDQDLLLLKKANCDIVYIPQINDLYDSEEKAKDYNFGSISILMEGAYRPGHFNGVATIIEKFFNLIKPTTAFFGEKDLQQLQVIKALTKQMRISVKIISSPTVREKNGLAKSSRNKLLSSSEKDKASVIYKYLVYCKKNKIEGVSKLKRYICKKINANKDIQLEYIEFVNVNKMERIQEWGEENESAICIAAYVCGVRLIDNIIL